MKLHRAPSTGQPPPTPPPAPNHQQVTKVNPQKNKQTPPGFNPEYTKIDRQVKVKSERLAMEEATNDMNLEAIKKAITHHHFRILTARCSHQGTITLETPPNLSANTRSNITLQTNSAVDWLNISVDTIYRNSCCTQNIFHLVPAHIGTTNSTELCAKMTEEINFATRFTLGPWPRWPTRPEILVEKG